MKTIVVLSDTHGNKDGVRRLSAVFKECDYVVHLGDGALDMSDVLAQYPKKTYVCRGNCDCVRPLPEGELEVDGVKNFLLPRRRVSRKNGLVAAFAGGERARVFVGSLRSHPPRGDRPNGRRNARESRVHALPCVHGRVVCLYHGEKRQSVSRDCRRVNRLVIRREARL